MVRKLITAIESGEATPRTVLDLCLRRIAELDPEVRAWSALAPAPRLADGVLHGLPFGAKDIFDARGLPFTYGSPLYAGQMGQRNAFLIEELLHAGATLIGKTQTCAFASFDPAPTRNPRLPGHSPGGSSAGSAAAVAAGMVPFAIGTQTLGSVLRPASYCGVCGFKPSFGLIPTDGILAFAPSLDTVGFFTQTADDMLLLWTRAFDSHSAAELHHAVRFRSVAEDPMEHALDVACAKLSAAGVSITEMDAPSGWDALLDAARTVNEYEGARSHQERFREFGDRLGVRLAALIRRGLEIHPDEYEAARSLIASMRSAVASIFWDTPVILTPAAPGPAPAGFDSTGDPALNAPWTALGLPAISVPLPVDGAPLGLQMTGAWGRDDALVTVAAQAERLLHAATI